MQILNNYGFGTTGSTCELSYEDDVVVQDNCSYQNMKDIQTSAETKFESLCSQTKNCTLKMDQSYFSSSCDITSQNQIYIQAECILPGLDLPFGKTLERKYLGVIVVGIDLAIVISFIIAIKM